MLGLPTPRGFKLNKVSTMNEPVRLFWVVDSADREREIFPTKELAKKFASKIKGDYFILISEVRNWYLDGISLGDGLVYNYDDHADTFKDIMTIITVTNSR